MEDVIGAFIRVRGSFTQFVTYNILVSIHEWPSRAPPRGDGSEKKKGQKKIFASQLRSRVPISLLSEVNSVQLRQLCLCSQAFFD